jgi:polysaccharide export outer membrane protein
MAIILCLSSAALPQNSTPASSGATVFPDTGARAPETNAVAERGDATLRLGTGDLVEVSVYGVPELNTRTRLGNSGDVYLPLVNYVHVGGLSVAEAETVIERRLVEGGFVKSPHVQLFVHEYTSQGVSILGEVAKPGVYPALGEQRLLDIVSAAGGFTDRAGKNITVTHRDRPEKQVVPLSRAMAEHPENNIAVYPGDVISVMRADVIYVVGDVVRPSGFMMNDGQVSVLQAIALAGGATPTAKLNAARIIHKGPSGLTETPVQLKKLLEAKTEDIPLQPDDILFIPTSSRKMMAGRTAEAAMQLATSATLIAIRP